MYTPTAYFWGRLLSNLLLQLFYPVTAVSVVFWGLKIKETPGNYLEFLAFAILLNFIMVCQGYFCGMLTTNEFAAQPINTMIILLSMLTSGGLGNAASFPTFV